MIPSAMVPIATHLWQSTLFAIFAALLILLLRKNQARVRYLVWLAASYKFLLPFSLLVSAGQLIHWRNVPQIEMSPVVSVVTDTVTMPVFFAPATPVTQAPNHLPVVLISICAVWAVGALVVLGFWMREWFRIRAVAKSAAPLQLDLPISVRTTSAQTEPGIFGIFRPTLLLPDGIADRLTPSQLKGVLAHEMAHARRKDNLTAMIHMLVEAIFWFHPLVWWIGARMVDERERACDEQVLIEGGEAQAYAESIVRICEYYLELPLRCVSGITGSDLKKRVQRIMGKKFGESLGVGKTLTLVVAGMIALTTPIFAGLLTTASSLQAQKEVKGVPEWRTAAGSEMAFDVASLKQNTSLKGTTPPHANMPMDPLEGFAPTGGLFSATNYPVNLYIGFAFKLTQAEDQSLPMQLPKWGTTERFDIEARASGNPTKDQYRLMVQSLLADRFKLALHFEMKETSALAFVLDKPGKLGPQLREYKNDVPCPDQVVTGTMGQLESATIAGGFPQICGTLVRLPATTGVIRLGGRNVPMSMLVDVLGAAAGTNQQGIDKTGLNNVDFILEFAPQAPAAVNAPSDTNVPNFQEALKEQLGLKLETATASVETVVIDHIEEPTPN